MFPVTLSNDCLSLLADYFIPFIQLWIWFMTNMCKYLYCDFVDKPKIVVNSTIYIFRSKGS